MLFCALFGGICLSGKKGLPTYLLTVTIYMQKKTTEINWYMAPTTYLRGDRHLQDMHLTRGKDVHLSSEVQ